MQCLFEIDYSLCISKDCVVVNGSGELFPEALPMEIVSIKGGSVKLRQLNGLEVPEEATSTGEAARTGLTNFLIATFASIISFSVLARVAFSASASASVQLVRMYSRIRTSSAL